MENRCIRWTIRVSGAALFALVVYVLSLGPAARIGYKAEKAGRRETAARILALYAPVIWVYRNSPQTVADAMDRYAALWMSGLE